EVRGEETIEQIVKGVVHEVLEGGGSVSEAEMHDEELIGAVATSKGGLPFVAVGDANQIEAGLEIDLRKQLRSGEAIEEFVDPGKGVPILAGNLVNTAIIDAEAKRTVLLLREDDRSASGRLRGADETLGQVFVDKIFDGLEFFLGLFVNRTIGRSGTGFEFNLVIVRASDREFVGIPTGEDIGEVGIDVGDVSGEGFRVGVLVEDVRRNARFGADQRLERNHRDSDFERALVDEGTECRSVDDVDVEDLQRRGVTELLIM